MTVDSDSWIELTQFEHCEPSPLAFRALVALLDTWPDHDQSLGIEYAEKLLRTWPDAVRMAPWSWCKAASQGQIPATWPLVRALELRGHHLGKGAVNLVRLAHYDALKQITELEIPAYSKFQEISFLYHHPDALPGLKQLRVIDRHDDGDVRALADSPLWQTLESFAIEDLTDSLVHRTDASRIVPRLSQSNQILNLTLRSPDLIAVWDASNTPLLRSASVFIRSIDEARRLAARPELSQLTDLSIAFRCGFNGSSTFEPFQGNVIEVDEAAAEAFFRHARLDRLESLAIVGYSMGYWGREGMGRLGLESLIGSGLLQRLKKLRLQLLPLGDQGVADLAPALGKQLERLELQDVYCKGAGAAALLDSPCLPNLRHLDLSANRIDAKHCALLAEVHMPHLCCLDLSGPAINPYYWNIGQQPILDAGAVAWSQSPNARQLRQLRLRNCHLTDVALQDIFQSPQLRLLEQLDLSDNSFTAAAMTQSVVGSPLWQSLQELRLNGCRLDNAAITELCRVTPAPALRSLQLAYNSIGPQGAAALANWSVLANVWQLELHDNLIGDAGLIALARSRYLGRLVELDLEQDCWNSRSFTFNDHAAQILATSRSLPRLDSMFSGCVDEYHGTAYSPGFTKMGLNIIRKSAEMRPAFRATCSEFSQVSEYMEGKPFDEQADLSDGDFRSYPMSLNETESESGRHNMQQIRSPSGVDLTFDENRPPKIQAVLAELDFNEEDILEGLEYRDPTPAIDFNLSLKLPMQDEERPLPDQVSKFLADALRSMFNVASMGRFDVSGGSSTVGDDGRHISIESSFSVGIQGDAEPAIQLLRETLWWIGAPAGAKLDEFPLDLTHEPMNTASRFLQLATPKITRWKMNGEPGHRIDRVPFTTAQRIKIQSILAEVNAKESPGGASKIVTDDSGTMLLYTKYLQDGAEFDTLNMLVEVLSVSISDLIHRLMRECDLMLMPISFAASPEVASTIDCDWPRVTIVSSSDLHDVLLRGPFHWWSSRSNQP